MDKNSQKIFRYLFFELFSWKVILTIPPLFFDARHFISWASKVKSQPFQRKSQKSPKIVKKLEIFQKFDFYHPGSDWLPKRAHLCLIFDLLWKKNFFLIKRGIFWQFFSKSQYLTPPTSQKVQQREVQSKNAIKKKSFFRRFKAACKKLEKFIGYVRRTFQIFFFGHIC